MLSPAAVRRHVTAPTPGDRDRLTATTARVRIFLPEPALAGLILVDTPGIGPLNRAAVAIRYRILPACDDILFAARAGALNKNV